MPRMGVTILATGVRYNANPTGKIKRVLRRLTNLASDRDTSLLAASRRGNAQ